MERCYFSFEDMIKNNDLGYFPYTPATQLLRGMRASLDLLQAEGLDNVFARHTRLAEGVRKAVAGWGLKLCAKEPKWHSDTVSAILVPDGVDSAQVVKTAFYRYNLSLGVGLNKVAGKVFRIGHLGALDEIMIGGALFGVEMALRDCGVDVVPGSGSGAAAEHFRGTTKASATSRAEPKLKLAS
jgi:alanine-glyoxylate transaminase/serine-glyoxylate transaminase/serine-pyruvate transaminase